MRLFCCRKGAEGVTGEVMVFVRVHMCVCVSSVPSNAVW